MRLVANEHVTFVAYCGCVFCTVVLIWGGCFVVLFVGAGFVGECLRIA